MAAALMFMRFEIRRTLRNVRFLVMLIAFPVILYLIYGTQKGTAQGLAVGAFVFVSMAVYSGMGSAMFASGPQLARERQNGWLRQLRVSPMSARGWFAAKMIQGVLMIIPGLIVMTAIAVGGGHVHLSAGRLGLLIVILFAGAIPFCVLGLVIGLMFDGQTAQVAQMITLIVLAFLGGIFIPWDQLPSGAQTVGKMLPSYHLSQLGWDAVGGRAMDITHPAVLAAWAVVLGAVAIWRWSKESSAG